MASVVGSDDAARVVDGLGHAIEKVSAPGAPGGDALIPKQRNGTTDNVNNVLGDYEIVSEIPSVPVTMNRPAFRPRGGLKEAGMAGLISCVHLYNLITTLTISLHHVNNETDAR